MSRYYLAHWRLFRAWLRGELGPLSYAVLATTLRRQWPNRGRN
jgi:hypothetical protein